MTPLPDSVQQPSPADLFAGSKWIGVEVDRTLPAREVDRTHAVGIDQCHSRQQREAGKNAEGGVAHRNLYACSSDGAHPGAGRVGAGWVPARRPCWRRSCQQRVLGLGRACGGGHPGEVRAGWLTTPDRSRDATPTNKKYVCCVANPHEYRAVRTACVQVQRALVRLHRSASRRVSSSSSSAQRSSRPAMRSSACRCTSKRRAKFAPCAISRASAPAFAARRQVDNLAGERR